MTFHRIFLFHIALLASVIGSAQVGINKPGSTQGMNEIDRFQHQLVLDLGLKDSSHRSPDQKDLIANSITVQLDSLQQKLETDPSLEPAQKERLLSGLEKVLKSFEAAYRYHEVDMTTLPPLIRAYSDASTISRNSRSIITVLELMDYKAAQLLISSFPYADSLSLNSDKELFVSHIFRKFPTKVFPVLFVFPDVAITDSLLPVLARRYPEDLYTYSQARFSGLGKKIHASEDSLVQLIAGLASKKEGQLYLPFTGSLIRGEISMAEISKFFGVSRKTNYFKLLVKTQIRYRERLLKGDTAIAGNALEKKLKTDAIENFVNVINGLHELPATERFKVIEPLSAQEIYYLCIAGADELYTSSFLYLYHRIFKTLAYPDSYALLQSVYFDHFKRFIKLASNFNTLPDFLKRMDNQKSQVVMKSFVTNLQYSTSLEDAVDVADSYAGIQDTGLRTKILAEVKHNLEQVTKGENKQGIIIYGLLNTLFTSHDLTGPGNMSDKLGIPSVYKIGIETLRDTNGKIIIQEFFYGDNDGKKEFNNFLRKYVSPQWKLVNQDGWVELHATDKSNIIIYANKPLDELKYKDVKAQDELRTYLAANNLVPTIVIHRGHSYFVKYTIRHLTPSVKLVLLGSCGGYNNLKQVIAASPYVHIIASKQEGNGAINQPIIVYLTQQLKEGKSLYWPAIWRELRTVFKTNRKFDDYIPPYQNLGAIFMMAFNRKIETGK